MTKKLFALFLASLLPISLLAGSGDVNGDGKVNVADIVEIINYLKGNPSEDFNLDEADLNNDGIVDENDIRELKDALLLLGSIQCELISRDIQLTDSASWQGMEVTIESNSKIFLQNMEYDFLNGCNEWIEYLGNVIEENNGMFSLVYHFQIAPNMEPTHRKGQIKFHNDTYNYNDILSVSTAGFMKVNKNTYNIINQGEGIRNLYIEIETNLLWEYWGDFTYEVISNSNWLHVSGTTIEYDNNNTGEIREAQILIKNDTHNFSDIVKVVQYPATFGSNSSNWPTIVCQPSGDIVEIPISGSTAPLDVKIWCEGESMFDFMHRLPDEIRNGDRYIRIQFDANTSERPRDYLSDFDSHIMFKIGDSYPFEFRFYQPGCNAPSYKEQLTALKAFYQATNGDSWTDNTNWFSDKPINQWHGVNNDIWGNDTIIGNYVAKINLDDNNLIGEIPEDMAKLMWVKSPLGTALEFNIDNNGLYGEIPKAVTNHPRWNELGWSIIQQNPYLTGGKTFENDGFNMKLSDGTVRLFVDDSETTVKDIIKQNEITLVYNRGWSDVPLGIDDLFVNLYLDYCNSGFGMVATVVRGEGWDIDGYINLIKNEHSERGLPKDILWAEEPIGNFGIGVIGSMYLVDKEGSLIQYYGGDGYIPDTWYYSQIDAILRARLGEPEEHDIYGDTYTSTDFSHDGEVMTLQTATVGKGIDIVLMGDAYVDEDIASGKYEQDMRQGVEQFFRDEVYAALRERFNVYAVTVVSPNRTTNYGGKWKLNYDDNICFEYAKRIDGVDMDHVTIINIVNNDNPGMMKGHANIYEGSGVAHIEIGGPTEVIIHEAGGHAFGKFADEYILGGYGGNRCPEDQLEAFGKWMDECHSQGLNLNVSATDDPTKVPWAHMLKDERYKDDVGIYQGAWMWPYDLWRATENSVMNTENYRFNAPCREAIYRRVMKLSEGDTWTYDFEKFAAFDAPIREAYKTANTRSQARGQNTQRKRIETRPPTIHKGTWRDALQLKNTSLIAQ